MYRLLVAVTFGLSLLTYSASANSDPNRSDYWLKECQIEYPLSCAAYIKGFNNGLWLSKIYLNHYHDFTDEGVENGELILHNDALITLRSADVFITRLSEGCIDEGATITVGQRRKIWVKYLHDHPESHHRSPFLPLAEAMQQAFKCD